MLQAAWLVRASIATSAIAGTLSLALLRGECQSRGLGCAEGRFVWIRCMIHYQLRCNQGHEFDSWFKDSAGFERQAKLGLIECPSCGDVKVERALMAPHVPSKRRSVTTQEIAPNAPATPQESATRREAAEHRSYRA